MKKTRRLFILVLALCLLVQMLPVGAFEIETPETAADVAQTVENTALKEETADTVEMYNSTYGQLVFYSGFNTDDPLVNEVEALSPIKKLKIASYSYRELITADERKGFSSKAGGFGQGSSDHSGILISSENGVWKYDGTDAIATGTVYIITDYYMDMETLEGQGYSLLRVNGGSDKYGVFGNTNPTAEVKKWQTSIANGISNTTGINNVSLGWARQNADTSVLEKVYFDDVKVYIKPDNALWLASDANGNNRTLKPASDETYTFPDTFMDVNVKIWTDGTNTYKAGVSYDAKDLIGNTFFPIAYTEMPETYDATYGQLLFYTGFNNETSKILTNEFEDSPVKDLAVTIKNGSVKVIGDNVVSRVTSHKGFAKIDVGKADGTEWTYSNGVAIEGNLTWFTDYSFENDQTNVHNGSSGGLARVNDSDIPLGWSFMEKNVAGIWATSSIVPQEVTQVKSVALWYVYIENNYIYYDNFKVYIQPTNAFWLTSDETGANRTFTVISGETYTLPSSFNNETVIAWTDGTTVWTAGKAVAKADVAAKTVYPVKVAEVPAEYDETYGQLVWFDNFSGNTGFTNLADITLIKNASDTVKVVNGYSAFQPVNGDSNVKYYEFERNRDTWTYTVDGKTMSGKVSVLASIYNNSGTYPGYGVQTVATPAGTWSNDTDDPLTHVKRRTPNTFVTPTWKHYVDYSLAEGKIMKPVLDENNQPVLDNNGNPKQTEISLTPLSPNDYQTIRTTPLALDEFISTDTGETIDLSRFGVAIADINSREYYARSLAVYIQPDNALWLVDANNENRAYEIASGNAYTFPKTFNGSAVGAWINGSTSYKAGETVTDLTKIAGKTWRAVPLDLNLADTLSVRTAGENSGIRFRATVNAATYHSEGLSQIGFMATRDKRYKDKFDGKDESFTLANANSKESANCAVVTIDKANFDRYIGVEPGSDPYFQAVVKNVPIKKAALEEKLHIRAFVVCGGITYYSNVKAMSVYEAVQELIKKNPDYANDEYIAKILAACNE